MKQKQSFQFNRISLVCLGRTLARNCWMIIASALIFGMAVSLALTWFHVPRYCATMTYSINSRSTSYTSAGNLVSTREVASVLTELLSTDVMNDSIREHDPRLRNFEGTISASQVGETNFIIVTATSDTPESAFLSLKALSEVFPDMANFISSRNVLNVMRNPTVSALPANQLDIGRIAEIAAVIGAILMGAILCYISVRSDTIQTRTGARQLLDAPILASVSHERKNRTLKAILMRSNRQVQVFAPTTSFAYTEQISTICTQMEHEAAARQNKVFLIAGVGENEGKSTVAGNIAATLALKGHKVALVDCDLRKPAMHRFFGKVYNGKLPLNKLLALPYSTENLKQCMVLHEQIGLYMLLSVNSDLRSAELLSGHSMSPLLQQLKVFDFVVLDSPPMGMFPDAEILADLVDASMLVVRQDYTAACDINDAIDSLNASKSTFMGCVLNDMLSTLRSQYGYGSKYGKGSKYGYAGKYAYQNNDRDERGRKSRTNGD